MSELSPLARRILEQTRGAHDPSPSDRERVRTALVAAIAGTAAAAGAAAAGAGVAAAASATGAAGTAASSAGAAAGAGVAAGAGAAAGAGVAAGAGAAGAAAGAAAAGAATTAAAGGLSAAKLVLAAVLASGAGVGGVVAVSTGEPAPRPSVASPADAGPRLARRVESGREREPGAAPDRAPSSIVPDAGAAALASGASPDAGPAALASAGAGSRPPRQPRREAAPPRVAPPAGSTPVIARPTSPPGPLAPPAALAAEAALLQRGTADLRRGDLAAALAAASEHEARFPSGALHLERDALRAMALCRSGRMAAGTALARSVIRRAGALPLAARVSRSCAVTDGNRSSAPPTGRETGGPR